MRSPPSTLKRHVSPALLAAVAAQCVTIIVWATALDARVGALESARAETNSVPERLARLEERVESVREDVAFIRRVLEKR